MRTTIYKYPLEISGGDLQTVMMPAGAQLLHFGVQRGVLCVWAKVVLDFTPTPRQFRVFGTGWELGINCGQHRGTAFAGPYVWHVFEVDPL